MEPRHHFVPDAPNHLFSGTMGTAEGVVRGVGSNIMSSPENSGKPLTWRNGGKQNSDHGFAELSLKDSRPANMAQRASWQHSYFTATIKGGSLRDYVKSQAS